MKKLFLLLIASLLLVFLTSCHGKQDIGAFEVPEEFNLSRNYTITFWNKNDSNIIQKNIYENAIEEFEKYYPNIHVEVQPYTDYTTIYSDVITNISTNTTPNVCITYPDHVATYLEGSNVVVPLDKLMDNANYGLGSQNLKFETVKKEEIVEKFLNECFFNNSYYCMPFMRSTEACYVNKDYVERLGFSLPDNKVLSWDFIWEVCEKAIEQKGEKDILYPLIYKSTDNMMIQMLKQKGYDYSDESGTIGIFNNNTKELLKDLSSKTVKTKKLFETFKNVSYPGNFFNKEQCIFAIDSTAGATWLGSEAPLLDIDRSTVVNFETVVCTVPQFDTSNPQMISQGPSLCIFNKEDKQEVLASWIFVQFLLTNSVQLAYAETEGYIPVTTKALESEDYQKYLNNKGATDFEGFDAKNSAANVYKKYLDSTEKDIYNGKSFFYKTKIEASELLIEHINDSFITPVFNGSSSLRSASGELIERTVKSTNRKESIDDAYFDSLFESIKTQYKLNSIKSGSITSNDLGELPSTSIALIVSIGAAWVMLGGYFLFKLIRKKLKLYIVSNNFGMKFN